MSTTKYDENIIFRYDASEFRIILFFFFPRFRERKFSITCSTGKVGKESFRGLHSSGSKSACCALVTWQWMCHWTELPSMELFSWWRHHRHMMGGHRPRCTSFARNRTSLVGSDRVRPIGFVPFFNSRFLDRIEFFYLPFSKKLQIFSWTGGEIFGRLSPQAFIPAFGEPSHAKLQFPQVIYAWPWPA